MFSKLCLAACLLVAVNGCSSPIEKHPYVVSIEYDNIHIGGGSIISRYYILTTAAIVSESPNLDLLTVRTGSSFSNKYGNVHNVCDVKVHPSWHSTYSYALAILRIVRPIVFSPTRQPLRSFYGAGNVIFGANVSVSAWPNLFVPGNKNASLSIFEGIVDKNCTKATDYGVFCMNRIIEAKWNRSAGRGHPVLIDGMQAGILVGIDNFNVMHIVDLGIFANWVNMTMKQLDNGLCAPDCNEDSTLL